MNVIVEAKNHIFFTDGRTRKVTDASARIIQA